MEQKKRGRKKVLDLSKKKSVSISISCPPEEYDMIMELVQKSGKKISEFVLDSVFGGKNG